MVMIRLGSLLIFALFQISIFGQTVQLDSVRKTYRAGKYDSDYQRFRIYRTMARNDSNLPLEERIALISESIELARAMDSTMLVIESHNDLARLEWQSGDPDASMETLFEMASEASNYGNKTWEAHSYSNIANNHKILYDFESALRYELRALDIYHSANDSVLIYNVMAQIADSYYNLERYDSARSYIDQGQNYYQKGDYTSEFVRKTLEVTDAFLKARSNQFTRAEAYFTNSLEYFFSFEMGNSRALWYIEFSSIFLSASKYEKAIEYATIGYKLAVKQNYKGAIRNGAQVLAEAYEGLKKPDSSLVYYKQYHAYKDSIVNIENVKAIEALRSDYEIGQKQVALDLATQQKENRQILAIAMAVVALLSVVFMVNYYRAYLKRKRLAVKLEALNATKDKFFSIVSHDLRGPISAFRGISGIIRGYLKQKSYKELEEMTDLIDQSADSISELLDNLLNWAVQQQGQVPYNPVPLDINQILETTLGIFETSATAKGISLSNEIGRSVFVVVDKDSTMTIFRNLVGNALKFTEAGGRIWVEAETKNAQVHVKVHDTGIGMTEEQVEKLFTTKEKRSYGTEGETGLGVGLQLVNEFVALNKGSLTVESEVGEGSVFIVSLPIPDVKAL